MSVFIGNLFTDEDDEKCKTRQEYCFDKDKSIYAISWAVEKEAQPQNFDDYKEKYKYKDDKGWKKAVDVMAEIKSGDFIWSRRRASGKYMLTKVKQDVTANTAKDFYAVEEADKYNLSVICEKWIPFDLDQVPGLVANKFAHGTIKHCCSKADRDIETKYIEGYCKNLYDGIKPEGFDITALKVLLHPDDEEDLLGIYLQRKGYILYPSTNKSGTAAYEYMLVKKEKGEIKKAIVQCKMGKECIDMDDLRSNEDFDIYCVTDQGKVKNKSDADKNLTDMKLDYLLQWAKDEENYDLLPDRIKKYMKICNY